MPSQPPTHSASVATSQLALIAVRGKDAEAFLQGQLTADVAQLPASQWTYAGHCDAKGKLWSVLRLWRDTTAEGGFYILMPQSSLQHSLSQLKKYAVFSQVEFVELTEQVDICLSEEPTTLHQVETDPHSGLISKLGLGDASLLVLPANVSEPLNSDDEAWLRYEIEHGVPCLTEATAQQFVPQMVGLEKLDGINYKKGCYIGQETIARMHYLGQNKRAAFLLVGTTNKIPAAGADLERSLGQSWRRAGAVLNAVRYDSGEVAVLAVLPADLEADATLRIKGDETSQLTPRPKFDNQEISHE